MNIERPWGRGFPSAFGSWASVSVAASNCHPSEGWGPSLRASRDPRRCDLTWMPAFAGTTLMVDLLEEIFPLRIDVHDLPQLPIAVPRLHRLLARDGFVDSRKVLGIDQASEAVAFAERRALAVPMLPDARGEVAGHADV